MKKLRLKKAERRTMTAVGGPYDGKELTLSNEGGQRYRTAVLRVGDARGCYIRRPGEGDVLVWEAV